MSSGQQNRFDPLDRGAWIGWHECMLCGENQWSDLHHIIAPTDYLYRPDAPNDSILNSSPLHNYPCHIGNDAKLAAVIPQLLNKTARALIEWQDYQLTKKDREFYQAYRMHYDYEIPKL